MVLTSGDQLGMGMPSFHGREVIGELYDAALGERAWHEVGRGLKDAVGGQSLILMVHQPLFQISELIDTQNLPEESLQTYATHYAPHDVWIRGMEEKKTVQPGRSQWRANR